MQQQTPNQRLAVHLRVKRFTHQIELLAEHGAATGGAVLVQPAALKLLAKLASAVSSYMGVEAKWQELKHLNTIEETLHEISDAQLTADKAANESAPAHS